jgi:hypothetical protein
MLSQLLKLCNVRLMLFEWTNWEKCGRKVFVIYRVVDVTSFRKGVRCV